jgi:hypothetical protein
MTVLSKVLFGSLRITSIDKPAEAQARSSTAADLFGLGLGGTDRRELLRCAAPSVRNVTAPCSTLRLDPLIGNIHSFEALEHTAVFDVLTPPYNDRAGRSCHYYEVAGDNEPNAVQLREIDWPDSLRVVNRPYVGPHVAL